MSKLHSMMTHISMSWFKESTERRKTSFLKEPVEKWRPTWSRIKQNNNYTREVRKIRFRSSFKRTNLNTSFYFHKYYFRLIKWKVKYAHYKCVSYFSVNVQKQLSKGVLQKRCSWSKCTGYNQCRSVISIKLYSHVKS